MTWFSEAIESALPEMRSYAESLMVDSALVSRADLSQEPDPLTGEPVWGRVHSGRVKVQAYSPYEQSPVVGDHSLVTQRYLVHFPMGSFDPRVDDVVEITASQHDSTLAGRRFRITAPFGKSFLTARRMYAEEVLG